MTEATAPMNHFRLLGRSGLRVSPLCLGTMTFGTEFSGGSDRTTSEQVLRRYLEAGGNFVDTANFYTSGTSEKWVGEFIAGVRDRIVLSTKYSLYTRMSDPNACGNHRKCLVQSLEQSLKRLKTDYIDLYWMHAWDELTPMDEVMRALDDVVRQGKVLYVGVSNTPAWWVARANTIAELRGWSPFVGLQIKYNLTERTPERELVPMAEALGLGITTWSPLEGGVLTGKYCVSDMASVDAARNIKHKLTDRNMKIAQEVVAVAGELGCKPSQVALAWLLEQPAVSSVILGARTPAQLEDNLASLNVELDSELRQRLEHATNIEPGYPMDFLTAPNIQKNITGGTVVW